MSFYLEKALNNQVWAGKFSSFEQTGKVVHCFSARFGGVSSEPYDSLNLAMHVGDSVTDVFRNRKELACAIGVDVERICTAEQVHGETIYRVKAEDAGRGVHSYSEAISETDALITDERNLPLMMCFADCVPIILFDPVNLAIGVAHGGWKGTVKHIAKKTLLKMGEEFGTRPEKCLVGIGPSIGPCCFSVGEDVAAEFRKAFSEYSETVIIKNDDAEHVDLWKANRLQLLAAGVEPGNIEMANVCTTCNSGMFFSYRADNGDTGRLAAMIALK